MFSITSQTQYASLCLKMRELNQILYVIVGQNQSVNIEQQKSIIKPMQKQYHSVRTINENQRKSQKMHRKTNSSLYRMQKHKLLGNKLSTINDRVQLIKKKYKSTNTTNSSLLDCQMQSMYLYDSKYENKQNESFRINSSVGLLDFNHGKNEIQPKSIKQRQKRSNNKKKIKQSQKIKQLQQINMKISTLIQNLKNQEWEQSRRSKGSNQKITIMNFQPILLPKSAQLANTRQLNISKITNNKTFDYSVELERSKSAIQRIKILSNSRKQQGRENGKIKRTSSLPKQIGQVQLTSKPHLSKGSEKINKSKLDFIKALNKQIELDSILIQNKTKLFKSVKNYSVLLRKAILKSSIPCQQQQILLDFNLQQIDPLFTQRRDNKPNVQKDQNYLIYQTIDSFLKAQTHWKLRLYKKTSLQSINLSDLDREDKGYFLKQDLTRFINILTRRMFCNREISLIFKRMNLKKNKIIAVRQFTNIFCF